MSHDDSIRTVLYRSHQLITHCLSYNTLYHVVDFKLWMCYIRFVEKHVDTHTHGEFIYVFLEKIYLTSLHARHYSVQRRVQSHDFQKIFV